MDETKYVVTMIMIKRGVSAKGNEYCQLALRGIQDGIVDDSAVVVDFGLNENLGQKITNVTLVDNTLDNLFDS